MHKWYLIFTQILLIKYHIRIVAKNDRSKSPPVHYHASVLLICSVADILSSLKYNAHTFGNHSKFVSSILN